MIELKEVFKSHLSPNNTRVDALKGINLNVKPGEIFGIIGKSGAGKSTLIRCVNRLETPDRGKIVVNGQDITALDGTSLRKTRRRIGMIFQHFNLLGSRTALENILLSLEIAGWKKLEAKQRALELLDLVKLKDKQEQIFIEEKIKDNFND